MLEQLRGKLASTIESYKTDLASVQTGRASSGLVEGVMVDSYGQKVPLRQVANITVSDGQSLTIQPWDKANLVAIEKAIAVSDLGLNPMNDGVLIRINIPALSAERREELIKVASQKAESARIAVRNLRHDILGGLDRQIKNKEIGEDEEKRMAKSVQDLVEDTNQQIDTLLKQKETEIRQV